MQGTLYIISAPSGGGKTSLVNALIAQEKNIEVSISHTTRPMRPGEKNGVNYYFVEDATFKKLLAEGQFLEHAIVFGNYYGTPRKWVEDQLKKGIDVILEIDWQGAQQTRRYLPQSVGIFIFPPSRAVLKQRLLERAQDNASVVEKRMALASEQMSHYSEYDYLVLNDDFSTALADLQAIIRARRLFLAPQQQTHAALLTHLLGTS